jgi:cytochrome c-type biogenesis protein CcmH
VLKRNDEAAAAWGKAAALAPGQLDVQVEYAGAIIQGRSNLDRNLPPEFIATVTRIRTLAPDHPLGLYYGGMVDRVKGDKASAKALWERVLPLLPPNSPQRVSLERDIKSLDD